MNDGLISFDDIADHLVKRMARRIVISPGGRHGEFAFTAAFVIAQSPDGVEPGHPYMLRAEADTPANAVGAVISMIYLWLQTPRAPWLVWSRGSVRTKAPGLVPEEPEGDRIDRS
jgi:hypothetical protein